jgi:NAD(P)-dependent dehydrogenase (short-subunit alcohol dehydrogenase family)
MAETSQKVMLVTGGSRGIGAAVARLAAHAGYAVCLSYIARADAAAAIVTEIIATGGKALAVAGDVSQEADVAALFEASDRAFGRLDVLVNNAGIVLGRSRHDAITRDRFARTLEVNVIGSFLCAKAAIARLSTKAGGRGGAIVNVSSRAAQIGGANEFVDYAASKGALDALTIGLAKEVATEGIRVNAVRPGMIESDIHASIGAPNRVAEFAPLIPMQRGGTPEEVAELVLWLASDAASYVTGALYDVSGGR